MNVDYSLPGKAAVAFFPGNRIIKGERHQEKWGGSMENCWLKKICLTMGELDTDRTDDVARCLGALEAQGISARLPACPLLPIAAGTDTCRMLCAKPAVELPVMTLHAELFGPPLAPFCRFNVKGVAGLPTSCRHYGESVPACVLRRRPSEARRFMFYFFTTAFGRSRNHFPPER